MFIQKNKIYKVRNLVLVDPLWAEPMRQNKIPCHSESYCIPVVQYRHWRLIYRVVKHVKCPFALDMYLC